METYKYRVNKLVFELGGPFWAISRVVGEHGEVEWLHAMVPDLTWVSEDPDGSVYFSDEELAIKTAKDVRDQVKRNTLLSFEMVKEIE